MSVPAITGTDPTAAATPPRAGSQVMDGDAYMQLFLVSLQNQDPSQPMSSAEMMQSTATLSQMQMLDSLSTVMSGLTLSQNQSTATSLIGKTISYVDSTTGKTITGKVDGVSMSGSSPVLLIKDQRVPLGNVSTVTNEP